MKNPFAHSFFSTYTNAEWIAIKVTLCSFWLGILRVTTINKDNIPFPQGLCTFFNCNVLAWDYTLAVFFVLAVVLTISYILEKWMLLTTFLMFLVSLILFTLEDSNRILNYNGLYTMTFLAQFIAYYRNNANLKSERIQFPIQVIAAGYTLAGISKLKESGLGWITDAPQVSIQILKNYGYAYFNSGDISHMDKGIKMSNFIINHSFFAKTLFAFSLFFEITAWIAIKNKATALVYGIFLTAMHIGIFFFMHIIIISIFIPMSTFMVNPLGLIYLFFAKLFRKNQAPAHP